MIINVAHQKGGVGKSILSLNLATNLHRDGHKTIILDADPQVTDPNDLRLSYVPKEHIAGLQGEAYIDQRHYGAANYAFNDGHAERSTKLKEQLALDWDLDPNTPNE